MEKWKSFKDLKKEWMQDSAFEEAYTKLEPKFELARALIKARVKAGLTQKEIAERMHTTQTVIARLESGRVLPSLKTLYKFAEATGKHVHVSFD